MPEDVNAPENARNANTLMIMIIVQVRRLGILWYPLGEEMQMQVEMKARLRVSLFFVRPSFPRFGPVAIDVVRSVGVGYRSLEGDRVVLASVPQGFALSSSASLREKR